MRFDFISTLQIGTTSSSIFPRARACCGLVVLALADSVGSIATALYRHPGSLSRDQAAFPGFPILKVIVPAASRREPNNQHFCKSLNPIVYFQL